MRAVLSAKSGPPLQQQRSRARLPEIDYLRRGSGSLNLIPKSCLSMRVPISVDVIMFYRNRAIVCGLASRWICKSCTDIAPQYAGLYFGGCSHVAPRLRHSMRVDMAIDSAWAQERRQRENLKFSVSGSIRIHYQKVNDLNHFWVARV